ncbi:MAG: hypothetical protein AABX60_03985, partial [Nanoarchaeota archaeon]
NHSSPCPVITETEILADPPGDVMTPGDVKKFTVVYSTDYSMNGASVEWKLDGRVVGYGLSYSYFVGADDVGEHMIEVRVANGRFPVSRQIRITVVGLTTSSSFCSPVKDDVCLPNCGSAADADCCVNAGKCWYEGYGCYDCRQLQGNCMELPDGFCPPNCAVGSDADCCAKVGKCWVSGRGCNECDHGFGNSERRRLPKH